MYLPAGSPHPPRRVVCLPANQFWASTAPIRDRREQACPDAVIDRFRVQLRRDNDVVVEAPETFHAIELHDPTDVDSLPSYREFRPVRPVVRHTCCSCQVS